MDLVRTELSNSVFTITLDDVPRRNALSHQLVEELLDAIDLADTDPLVRVIVVTNEGTVFCAGANLGETSGDLPDESPRRSSDISEIFRRIISSPKPFVGRIAGHCVAGGLGLAAVMDISVAVDNARFGFTEVRIGVAPAIISVVCLPKMRLADAKSAFLRGDRFLADEAVRLGLINMSVAAESLDDAVTGVVNDLLAGEPGALAAAKKLTTHVPQLGLDEAFTWTTGLSAELFASDAAHEGMKAFLEKRPAPWVTTVDETAS